MAPSRGGPLFGRAWLCLAAASPGRSPDADMELLALIFGFAVLAWGLWFACRGSLALGAVLYLVALSCFGPHLLQFRVGVALSLDRLFLVGLVGAALVQARLGRTALFPLTRADFVPLAYIGVLAVSTFTHPWWELFKPFETPIQHLLNGYAIPLTLYFIIRAAKVEERDSHLVLGGLTAFGVYLAVTGLLEAAGLWSLVWPRYIANPEIGLHFGRARGPMVHSVSYGLYLCGCLLAAWQWGWRLSPRWRLLAWSTLPLLLAAAFCTKTRSVWLGAATVVLLALCCWLRGRVRVAVLGGAVTAGLLVGLVNFDAILGLQREGTVEDTRQSVSMRGGFTYVSWLMFQEHPLWGVGFGHFAKAKLPYLSDRNSDVDLESIRLYVHHNTFLSVLTEVGLIGLALMLTMFLAWALAAWNLARAPRAPPWRQAHGVLALGVLAASVWQMLGHEITFTPHDHALIFLVCGLAVGLSRQEAATAAPAEAPGANRLADGSWNPAARAWGRWRFAR